MRNSLQLSGFMVEDIKKSGLFDVDWYSEVAGLSKKNIDEAICHYVEIGVHKGLNPSEKFSTLNYLKCYQDVDRVGINPLIHYIKSGKKEGRSPLGIEEKFQITRAIRKFPRFGGSEYGKIDKQIFFDEFYQKPVDVKYSLCVHLHLFHQEMANEFCGYLNNLKIKFDLFVSICHADSVGLENLFLEKIKNINKCVVREFENKGRDVAPWVVGFSNEIKKYDLFYHFHSKKSDYKSSYRGWRKFLLHNTIGSEGVVNAILELLIENENSGIVYPPYFPSLPNQPKWGANKGRANNLMELMGMKSLSGDCPDFPSGSFFWAKVKAIQPLLEVGLQWKDFAPEEGQLDGTLAHAIERILGVIGSKNNFKSFCAGLDVSYNLINYWDQKRCDAVGGAASALRLEKIKIPKKSSLRDKKIAVFSCITGGFDNFVMNPAVDEGVDYFVYSDVLLDVDKPYQARVCKYFDPDPRRMARFVKMHPHFFFPDYDYVVWMDGNVFSVNGIQDIVEKVMVNDWDIGFIAHPLRDGYGAEAEECLRIAADDAELIKGQIDFYKDKNLKNVGLMETNVIVCNPKLVSVKNFFNIWWREICCHSLRDQISVSYAISQSDINYGYILERGSSVRDAAGFLILAHGVKL